MRPCCALERLHDSNISIQGETGPAEASQALGKAGAETYEDHVEEANPLSWAASVGKSITEQRMALKKAGHEAATMQFNKCIATLDSALKKPDCFFFGPYESVRSYALFRVGRDEEARIAAQEAVNSGCKSKFAYALANGDSNLQSELRRFYPIFPAAASATTSQAE